MTVQSESSQKTEWTTDDLIQTVKQYILYHPKNGLDKLTYANKCHMLLEVDLAYNLITLRTHGIKQQLYV